MKKISEFESTSLDLSNAAFVYSSRASRRGGLMVVTVAVMLAVVGGACALAVVLAPDFAIRTFSSGLQSAGIAIANFGRSIDPGDGSQSIAYARSGNVLMVASSEHGNQSRLEQVLQGLTDAVADMDVPAQLAVEVVFADDGTLAALVVEESGVGQRALRAALAGLDVGPYPVAVAMSLTLQPQKRG
ncbi:MAG: hypothetical protein AAFX94_08665 [Myxococcota bacterium]